MVIHDGEENNRRALLFGGRAEAQTHRRPNVGSAATSNTATNLAAGEKEMMEQSNSLRVEGLRGRVGEMRHVSEYYIYR